MRARYSLLSFAHLSTRLPILASTPAGSPMHGLSTVPRPIMLSLGYVDDQLFSFSLIRIRVPSKKLANISVCMYNMRIYTFLGSDTRTHTWVDPSNGQCGGGSGENEAKSIQFPECLLAADSRDLGRAE